MKNKKQNSIDWFINHLIKCGHNLSAHKLEIQQAKQMHKEEIKQSYREGRSDQQSKEAFYHRNAEQYYNEKFGGNNE